MSTPGSSNRNNKYEDGRRRQTGGRSIVLTLNSNTSGWTAQDRANIDALARSMSPPLNTDLFAAPTGPFTTQMGTVPFPDSSRAPSRHHKTNSHSQPGGSQAAPSYYSQPGHTVNGSAAVQRTPSHITSQRMNDFPPELGGGAVNGYPDAPPKTSQRPNAYPQSGHQTAPYPAAMQPAPNVPRSPDRVTGQRITMAMAINGARAGTPVSNGKQPDPRYSSNGRGQFHF
ncbi:hypothetical protein B0H10DRAFT_2210851 [Mycena sp. CBHHK59/15]|nr:hypothetical protein B0H10DRAFT_2210851 [Mycena sp. CBHHK59/15]